MQADRMRRLFFSLLYGAGFFLLLGMLWRQGTGQVQAAAEDSLVQRNDKGYMDRLETSGRPDGSAPVVALTFDDGPHPVYTGQLLDGLSERGIKATFFVIGVNVEGHEEIVERMAEEGHLIGNHTYNHVQLTRLSGQKACEEIDETNTMLEEICGSRIVYIRPPFGSWPKNLSSLTDMQVVLWSVDPLDWKRQDTEAVVQAVLKNVKDGDIILLHDVYKTSVEAALQIIDRLTEEGYEFARIDELLLD
jgi:peptidoglycan/xylan/chitin deacetylase (PgdA/CDA1 family)